MKKFITTNLLLFITLPLLACAWVDTHNFYLFRVCNNEAYKQRIEELCNNNWRAYLGISESEDYFYFDADQAEQTARERGDLLMANYIVRLQEYIQCAKEAQWEHWDYPTKEQLAARKQTLQKVRTYAQGKLKTKLRSQHALLFMRCNMMLGRHQENITFWEETASKYIDTVYKEMMKNIYAGALYKTGKDTEAGQIFGEQGDYESLMTQYYKRRSFAAIRQEYLRDANSKVLPFLLQDFVNNAQEADDATNPNAQGVGGKLFIRDITKTEALQMRDFCQQVVQEGRTESPALWQTAKAWLEYMYGSKQQASKDIIAAAGLDGDELTKNCTRSLMLYITAAQAKPSEAFDQYLADELEWFSQHPDMHYAIDRITRQVLVKHYANQPERVIALCMAQDDYMYYIMMDTIQVSKLEKYLFYANTPGKNPLDSFLKQHIKNEPGDVENLIGTKYMRICQWDKAIEWLKGVPAQFYENRAYAVYAAHRKVDIEPWIRRQFLKSEIEYSHQKWTLSQNPRLAFAQEMQQLEATIPMLSGKALLQRYYDLAIRYTQANYRGDCWWLMRDAKSYVDTLRVNEVDLAGKARELLRKVSLGSDPTLKEKALFALCYVDFFNEKDRWYHIEWENGQSVRYGESGNPQYKAYAQFVDFVRSKGNSPSTYVSRCDEYIQFCKQYK